MKLIEQLHDAKVIDRRVRILSDHLSTIIPEGASVLDVGCGDGQITEQIKQKRPDISIKGVEVLVRPNAVIQIEQFDGSSLPFEDKSFDCVLFVDVLHHTDDPMVLLQEAVRVSKKSIVIKDHLKEGVLANTTLSFMDKVGNARHGVVIPHNYWTKKQWKAGIEELGLETAFWSENLGLYPAPFTWIFDRSLHMITRLTMSS